MTIREIKREDNSFIEKIIKKTIVEFGLPTKGTAYADIETTQMFESYQEENEIYFVIENENNIVGGAGIKALKINSDKICELQKMYFDSSARGKGYGDVLINKCLDKAKEFGYKKCYLETDPRMTAAIHLYEKNGFTSLNEPMGSTGHVSCRVWMLKEL